MKKRRINLILSDNFLPIHVYPLNDFLEHKTDGEGECFCKPWIEENGKLIIHNSYDKRELLEATIIPANYN